MKYKCCIVEKEDLALITSLNELREIILTECKMSACWKMHSTHFA